MSSRWFQIHLVFPIQPVLRLKWARPAAAVLTLLLVVPVAAMAQGSPFDTGFNAIQALFTGTIAKVASLVAIVIGGYGFAHGEPGAKKALAGVAAGTGIAVLAVNVLSWLWGIASFPATFHSSLDEDVCQSNHRRCTAQIEYSRVCTSRSPTWALNAHCSTSSASAP
jgi:type IV secretory pathway VirB2 component (pilin)